MFSTILMITSVTFIREVVSSKLLKEVFSYNKKKGVVTKNKYQCTVGGSSLLNVHCANQGIN